MIGNAHIDPVWLWRWYEGFQEIRKTFYSMIELIRSHPDFIFTCSSAAFYEWIEDIDPELFREIQSKVSEGRWCIVGGWWIEPDCNIPCGESLVRQALYGQRYFAQKFGVKAKVGYNIDSFGHNWMLPQILKKSGIHFYVSVRPNLEEKPLPSWVFWWESPDGSRVLTHRIPFRYSAWGENLKNHILKIAKEAVNSSMDLMCFFGRGDHGGGPTTEDLEIIKRLNEKEDMTKILLSSPDIYFRSLKEQIASRKLKLPTVRDELQHHARGCYSANLRIKRLNRQAENLLITTEKLSTMAYILVGIRYPEEDIRESWKKVLFCQFHDILSGTCIKEAYEDVYQIYGAALYVASKALNKAVQAISAKIDTCDCERAIIVFNHHPWKMKWPVEVEIPWKWMDLSVVDEKNEQIEYQLIKPSATLPTGKNISRIRLCLFATVPPLGYNVYKVLHQETPDLIKFNEDKKERTLLKATEKTLENRWLKLELDTKTGWIKSLIDKCLRINVFNGFSGIPIVISDPSDTWGHGVSKFNEVIGRFQNPLIKIVEKGPIRARIRVKTTYGSSTLVQDMIMYRDLDFIECRIKLNWQEKHKMLKIAFPVNVESPEVTYEIPYGYIKRPNNGEEEPGLRWIDVTGIVKNSDQKHIKYGLSLINDCIHSFDVTGSTIRMTLLRSPVYAHYRSKLDPATDYEYLDQGEHHITYYIKPHRGGWTEANVLKLAALLNAPPISIVESNHPGSLPLASSFLSVEGDKNVEVDVLKKSEESEDIILRCHETFGRTGKVKITIHPLKRTIILSLKRNEIKTIRIPLNSSLPHEETNLIESL